MGSRYSQPSYTAERQLLSAALVCCAPEPLQQHRASSSSRVLLRCCYTSSCHIRWNRLAATCYSRSSSSLGANDCRVRLQAKLQNCVLYFSPQRRDFMEEVCGSLEIEFRRIVNDLHFVTHRIENDFRALKCPNPLHVSKRLAVLERRMERIQEKMTHLNEMKRAELSFLQTVVRVVPYRSPLNASPAMADAMSETNCCRDSLKHVMVSSAE